MDETPASVRIVAHAANQTREYAEVRLAELEHALAHMQHRQEVTDRQHLSQRMSVHVAGLTIALILTLATLGLGIPEPVKFGLPFLPSVALEVIDKYLRF
jgi:hypothetical protein